MTVIFLWLYLVALWIVAFKWGDLFLALKLWQKYAVAAALLLPYVGLIVLALVLR